MLELAILGLLKEQDLHGYELKKRLAEVGGPAVGSSGGASYGSLYPALKRLEKSGAVETSAPGAPSATPAEPTPIPMTGSLGGELAAFRARRAAAATAGTTGPGRTKKKVYRITLTGEALFEELLAAENQTTDDDRTFHLKLAFARHLPPDARLGLLERRRAHLVERLAQARASMRQRFDRLDAYTRSLVEHSRETTERDISWLDGLIENERAGSAGPDQKASSQ